MLFVRAFAVNALAQEALRQVTQWPWIEHSALTFHGRLRFQKMQPSNGCIFRQNFSTLFGFAFFPTLNFLPLAPTSFDVFCIQMRVLLRKAFQTAQ